MTLAALLTVVAGPSAAASAVSTVSTEQADSFTPSVAGIAPNGGDATMRAGNPMLPLPFVVPWELAMFAMLPCATVGDTPVRATPNCWGRSQQDRAPPTG